MELDKVIETLSDEHLRDFPEQALTQARALWPELLPHIDTLMDKFIQQQELSESEYTFLLFGLFLLADQAEASRFEAFVQLCDNGDEEGDPLDHLLGDSICQSLPTMLFILAKGRSQPLIDLLLSDRSGEYVKSSTLSTLIAQIEAGQFSVEQFDALIPDLLNTFSFSPFLQTNLAEYIVHFDLRAYQLMLLELFENDQIEALELPRDVIENWQLPHYCSLPKAKGYVEEQLSVMDMRTWAWFNSEEVPDLSNELLDIPPEELDDVLDYIAHHTPYVAPPKVGRNEPCPCGSGKKYKKCCLSS